VRMVGRMQEAALDVLFNKRSWGKPDGLRRKLRVPRTGSHDRHGSIFATVGKHMEARLEAFHPFDAHGALEVATGDDGIQQVTGALPDGLWAMLGDSLTLAYGGQTLSASDPGQGTRSGRNFSMKQVIYAADDDGIQPVDAPGRTS